jgi:succinate dehydrogenase / fumarate reductase cytochrome b subunit
MSATATSEPADGGSCRCGCGTHRHGQRQQQEHHHANCRKIRAPRRLHSLLAAPLALFVLLHLLLLTSATAPAHYQRVASGLSSLAAKFHLLETVLLLLIVVQSFIGLRLLLHSGLRYRTARCQEDRQLPYFLQRWSGVVILVFLLVHLPMLELRLAGPTLAAAQTAMLIRHPLMTGFYALTIGAVGWHLGNGVWTAASLWGWRQSRPALWLGLSVFFGSTLAIGGGIALCAFAA